LVVKAPDSPYGVKDFTPASAGHWLIADENVIYVRFHPGEWSKLGMTSCRATRPISTPIEHVFARLKTLLRKTDPRTSEATWRAIGTLLGRFKPEECANYLVNAGYASA
jgi:hypothetical protein